MYQYMTFLELVSLHYLGEVIVSVVNDSYFLHFKVIGDGWDQTSHLLNTMLVDANHQTIGRFLINQFHVCLLSGTGLVSAYLYLVHASITLPQNLIQNYRTPVAYMVAYKFLVGKPEWKRILADIDVDRKIILKWTLHRK